MLKHESNQEILLKGKSMWPLLQEGDTLLYMNFSSGLFKGDLVLFNNHETKELVTHRIIKTKPLITKGDFSCFQDTKLDSRKILGKIIGLKRKGREFRWGENGHFFKRISSYLCILSGKNKLVRYIALILLFIISKIVFLATESHTSERP